MLLEACLLGLCVLAGFGMVAAAITSFTNHVLDMYCELASNAEEAAKAEKAKAPAP